MCLSVIVVWIQSMLSVTLRPAQQSLACAGWTLQTWRCLHGAEWTVVVASSSDPLCFHGCLSRFAPLSLSSRLRALQRLPSAALLHLCFIPEGDWEWRVLSQGGPGSEKKSLFFFFFYYDYDFFAALMASGVFLLSAPQRTFSLFTNLPPLLPRQTLGDSEEAASPLHSWWRGFKLAER